MKRWYYPALALFLGLFVAQVLATAQVYLSNVQLYGTLLAVRDAGYFPIPNEQIMPRLQQWGSALFGGLFFTLSTGAGLSLLSLAAAWLWDRLFYRIKSFLILYFLLWVLSLVLVNRQGFNLLASLYFILIPPLVFAATLRWIPPQTKRRGWPDRMILFLPIFLLAMSWTYQIERQSFLGLSLDLRDHFLFSSPLGREINDFYYNYTPYPTNVIEPLDQKTLRTCNLEEIQKMPMRDALERTLINYDYLNVGGVGVVDLEIGEEGNNLVFRNRGETILNTKLGDFLSGPGTVLKEFSIKSDRYHFFRSFTLWSLMVGFPISLYIIFYTLLRLILGNFMHHRASSLTASALCFIAGMTLLAILQMGRDGGIGTEDLTEALESDRWQKRVAALKIIEQKGLEISNFSPYQRLLRSSHVPERYWLAKALGVSRQPGTFKNLVAFLDDPHPNVVRMAFYSMGRRGDKRSVSKIMKKIETSDHWYNQRQAYQALRTLRWKQSKNPHPP